VVFDGGYAWDGGVVGWDGGGALDAGARAPYDPCAVLACDADAGQTCITTAEGPASCLTTCNPAEPVACGAGQYCDPTTNTCQYGCIVDAQCNGDAGLVCRTCEHTCVRRNNPDAGVGDVCARSSGCMSGGRCFNQNNAGFPGGYCTLACSPGTCSCPDGSECLGAAGQGYCFQTCSVASQNCARGADAGYVCQPLAQGDTGACLPACAADTDCAGNTTFTHCDPTLHYCEQPDGGLGATTGSSSGSTGGSSSGSSGSSGTSGGSSSGSSGSTGSAGSSGSGSSSGAAASSSSGGSTGSNGAKAPKKGCGCGSGAGAESGLGLLALLALRRRRAQLAR
jgi:hypothetical protein